MMVKKFNELNESKFEYSFELLNNKLLSECNTLGLIYAFKTDNINKKYASIDIFKSLESYLYNCDTIDAMNNLIVLLDLCLETDIDIDMNIGDGYTITSYSMEYGNLYIVDYLIRKGADDLIKNDDGENLWEIYERVVKQPNFGSVEAYSLLNDKYKKWKNIKKFKI